MALPDPVPGAPVAVTGASSGIGEAIARELARSGHDVILVARREARLEELARELRRDYSVTAEVEPADLSDRDQRAALAASLAARPLAGLVADAGTADFGPVAGADPAALRELVALNVGSLVELVSTALPGMVERGRGAIGVVASILGHGPVPHLAVYAASKAFAVSFAEATHAELLGTGVSCTAVSVGPVRTGIYGQSDAEPLETVGPEILWQQPDDVARPTVAAMRRGARSVTPGVVNRLAAAGNRFLPRSVVLPLEAVAGEVLRRASG